LEVLNVVQVGNDKTNPVPAQEPIEGRRPWRKAEDFIPVAVNQARPLKWEIHRLDQKQASNKQINQETHTPAT